MMQLLTAFVCGLVFSLGLGMAGMTLPTKVIGFLDIAGHWDPSLAFVMAGAVAVTAISFPIILRRNKPVLGDSFNVPTKTSLDRNLLLGSALFGTGWGLTGYCPGPAIVSLVTGTLPVLVFVGFMLLGFVAARN